MGKIINNKEVAILMATYNGEKYIKEQIDSLLEQTFINWNLYIQDDGSIDRTIEIVQSYDDSRITIVDNGLTHPGPCLNFMNLLNIVESQYYMFCDQDDVWLPDKIAISYERMKIEEQYHNDLPILVHTDYKSTDAFLNIIKTSEYNKKKLSNAIVIKKVEGRKKINQLRLLSVGIGCTFFFNYNTKKVSFPFSNMRMHDMIISLNVMKNERSSGDYINTDYALSYTW